MMMMMVTALRKNKKKRTNMVLVIIFYIRLTSCLSMHVSSQKNKTKTWMRISMKTSLKPFSCNGVLKKSDFILS
jgi:cell division protein FtsW (lipid II flippase)